MQLAEYAKQHGRGSIPDLARRAGVHSSRLYEILRGHVPKADIAKRIAAATGGEVTAAELLGIESPTVTTTSTDARPEADQAAE